MRWERVDNTELISKMNSAGVRFSDGLTQSEFGIVEQEYNFKFPPDLKELLSIALPISDKFINWRDKSERNVQLIQERFDWCLEGMLFDVEYFHTDISQRFLRNQVIQSFLFTRPTLFITVKT